MQQELRDRLAVSLRTNQPKLLEKNYGFDRLFAASYEHITQEDSDLHSIIRGYTEHAISPLNDQILNWLAADYYHRTFIGKSPVEKRLATMLNELEAHLFLWSGAPNVEFGYPTGRSMHWSISPTRKSMADFLKE